MYVYADMQRMATVNVTSQSDFAVLKSAERDYVSQCPLQTQMKRLKQFEH
jgi:hypothetical protein